MVKMSIINDDCEVVNEVLWNELASYIEEYNRYVEERIRTIMDFDMWYEHTTAKEFPNEWYVLINANANKAEDK